MARQVTVSAGNSNVIAQAGSQVAQEIRNLGYTVSKGLQEVQARRDEQIKMETFNDISQQSSKIYRDNKESPADFDAVYQDYSDKLLESTPKRMQPRIKYQLDQAKQSKSEQVAANFDRKQNKQRAGESWTYNVNTSNDILTSFRQGNLEDAELRLTELKTSNVASGLYTPEQVEEMDYKIRTAGKMQRVKGGAERALSEGGLTELEAYKATVDGSQGIFDSPDEKDKANLSIDRMISGERSRLKQLDTERKAKQAATKKIYQSKVKGLAETLQLGYEVDEAFVTEVSQSLDVLDMQKEQADLDMAMMGRDFARMNQQERQVMLDRLVNKSPENYSYFKSIDNKVTQLEKADPLTHYQRQGKITVDPVDYTDPQSINARNRVVAELEEMTGIKSPLLTGIEQKQLVAQFNEMPANQKVSIVGSLVQGLGSDSIGTLNSISKKNGAVLALGGQLFMDNAPEVAESIFMGQDVLLNNKAIMPKDSELNTSLSTNIGTAYTSNPLQRKTITSSIKAVYADLSRQEGDLSAVLDEDRLQTATDMVTGGLIKYESGQWKPGGETSTIEPPVRGMATDFFEDWIEGLKPEDIESMGGSNMNSKEVIRILKDEAQIESVRVAGKTYPVYIIKTESGAIGNKEGNAPFYLEYTQQ